LECVGDLLVELLEGIEQALKFLADKLHSQGHALQHGDFIGERYGFVDAFQALADEFLTAGAVEVIKLFDRSLACLAKTLQGRPLEQELGGQRDG
jgi:hypothetical protein